MNHKPMNRKRRIVAGVVTIASIALFTGTALAHGGGHGKKGGATTKSSQSSSCPADPTTRVSASVKTRATPDATDPLVSTFSSKVKVNLKPGGSAMWTIDAAMLDAVDLIPISTGDGDDDDVELKARVQGATAPLVLTVSASNDDVPALTCTLTLTLASATVV